MRLQSNQSSCGSASLHNALCALGMSSSLERCEAVCKVDAADGTPPKRIIAGARAMGLEVVTEIRESREDVAQLRLDKATAMGLVALLVVDADEHWVAVVGRTGQRYLVADSADSELVISLAPQDLAERWRGLGRRPFYAVVVGAP